MVLTMMANVAEFETRWLSERTKEVLAAAKARGVCLGGFGKVLLRRLRSLSRSPLLRLTVCVESLSQWCVLV
ncbi:recombinase family protein [Synechococcus sp. A10-1-5-9]|uniref:recombinase family protein n=1 Tax=Synechococcus sp. A10-1-5-9 TaxID=3392295 RepID=UPI0039EAA382